ncbi:hypothetical protein HY004_02740 [Candidatus Saccharibacteria bacterium]|nr:hypothetical protein [Candidatus Saccharibacteria bacterium]
MRKIKQIAGVAFTISSVLGLVWLAKNLERILAEEEQMREEQAYMQG